MKRKLNITAALATTAAAALLAGAAHAQTPEVCTTTQINPGHNNCVMPTAQAPGGGSFPGSFRVPGTNTSFAVHGFVQFDIVHDFGPHFGVNTFGPTGQPIEGPGVSYPALQSHSANGGTEMEDALTRPDIETRTPTAYGELKTYIEFDFNQTGASQLAGNNDLLRMRQAYGTLGPWLLGQTLSAFADPAAYSEVVNGVQDVGMMNTTNVRRPQIRYTWLAGNGLTIAGSVEQPTYNGNVAATSAANGAALATIGDTGASTGGYNNWPAFVQALQWSQPWGHLQFAAGEEINEVRSAGATPATSIHTQNGGYALHLSGHLNTVGKDALRGGIVWDDGAANFSSEMTTGGELYNTTTGARSSVKEWTGYASYEHFFTGQWRANATGGYAHFSGNPGFTSNTTLASMNKEFWDVNLNVIYSPVPQTDFLLEWERQYRKTFSGADGTGDRIDGMVKFYF
jgi:Porin subfamily